MDPAEKALSHPSRAEMLDHLTLRANAASGRQLAEAFGLTLGQAGYHLHVLCDADLVVKAGSVERRGAVERYYVAAVKAVAG